MWIKRVSLYAAVLVGFPLAGACTTAGTSDSTSSSSSSGSTSSSAAAATSMGATSGSVSGSSSTASTGSSAATSSVPASSSVTASSSITASSSTITASSSTITASSSTTTASSGVTASSSLTASSSAAPACTVEMATGTVLVGKQLLFGEGNNGQWKSLGFNLDGLVSDASGTGMCQPNAGANAGATFPDGNNGIDNGFGKNILPVLLSILPTLTVGANQAILSGESAQLLKLYCLPSTGDVPSFTTRFFRGSLLGMAPVFDGTDVWTIAPETLSSPTDPDSSTLQFAGSSVTGNTYASGTAGAVVVTVPVTAGATTIWLNLTLHGARMTMTLAADRKSASAAILGGVLNTEEFVQEIRRLGNALGLCGNPLLDNLITQVRQASDIMTDGSQDVSNTCDGISIGLGFEWTEAQFGTVGPATPPAPTCP